MSLVGTKFGKVTGIALVLCLFASSGIAGTIGQKRCMILDKQLSGLVHKSKTPVPRSVDDLADKAQLLCSKGKTAQGLRAYAKALKIMGSQPVFPSEQPLNARKKS